MCENEEHVICSVRFFFDSFSFSLCGSRNIHEFYCVSHKNFLFNSDLAINFKKIRICGIPCIIESNSTPTEPHKMLYAFSVSSCHILFFCCSTCEFLLFCSPAHDFSRCHCAIEFMVSKSYENTRELSTLYIYPFFICKLIPMVCLVAEYYDRTALCVWLHQSYETLAEETRVKRALNATQLNWIAALFFFINVLFSSSEPSLTLLSPQYIYGIINAHILTHQICFVRLQTTPKFHHYYPFFPTD